MNPFLSRRTALLSLLMLSAASSHIAWSLSTDREQPVHISSENGGQADRAAGVIVYQGNVKLSKGSLKLDADTVTVKSTETEAAYIAEGDPATMQQQPEAGSELIVARGNRIEYYEHLGKIVFVGNASIKQGDAVHTADRLEYDIGREILDFGGRIETVIPPRPAPPPSEDAPGEAP